MKEAQKVWGKFTSMEMFKKPEWQALKGTDNRMPFQFGQTDTALDYQPEVKKSLPVKVKEVIFEAVKNVK